MNSKPTPRNFLHRLVQLAAGGTVLLGLFVLAAWASGRWSIAAGGAERVPMAPGTAAAFAFLGLALWSWLQHPESRGARGLAAVCGAIVGASAVTVLVPAGLGFVRPWAHWFPVIATTSAGVPVGHMSPITAAAFLLSAAGMLVQLFMPARRRMARWTGQTATLAAGLIGFVIAMGHAVGTAPFYGSGIIPMALLTALAFMVFNGGVLLAGGAGGGFWGHLFARPESETGTSRRRFARRLVGLAVGLFVAIGGTAFLYLRQQQATVRQHVLDDLSTVADLKVEQIADWRNERLSDARFFAKAAFVARDLRTFLDDPAGAAARAEVLGWLDLIKAGFRYKHVTLLNRRLQPLLSVPEGVDRGCTLTLERAALKSGTNQVTVTDLHRGTGSNDAHLSILFRVFPVLPAGVEPPGAPQAMGVILLHLDPRLFLYPLIQSWPIQSRSAETLLVRREGTDVLFLNELRHQSASALSVRIPLSQTNVPAVRAVLGERGLVSGEDYRGVPVVAAIRAIPDSPWFLVAKMDQAEIYAPLRWQAVLAGSVVGVLLLATGLGVTMLWRQRAEELLRGEIAGRLQVESERDRFFNLSVDMLCVAGLDGYFKQVNAAWTRTLGWSAEELRSAPWLDWVHPEDRVATEAARASLREGQVVYAFENRYRCKDGGYRWIEWHSFPLPEEGLLFGVARDVTTRKRADRVVARFSELGHELSAAATTEVAGRALFQTAQDLLGWDACFLNLREGETRRTTLMLGMDTIDGRRVELDPATFPHEFSPVEQTVLDRGPQLVLRDTPDERAEEFVPFGDVARRSASLLFVPLRHQGRCIGIVSIQSYQPRAYDAVGLDLLQALADYTASAFVRLHAERSLRDNEERLRLALAAAGQGLYDLNVQTGAARVSPEYATMLGHDPAGFAETNAAWIERLHPDDREPVAAAYRAYVRGDLPEYRVEFRQRTKQGDWKWILSLGSVVERDAQGTPLRMLGTHTDITARKEMEAALRESEARFRTLVEEAPEAIFIQTQRCFAYVNSAAVRLFGAHGPGQLIGQPVVERFRTGFQPQVSERIHRLNETRQPVPDLEEMVVRFDGGAVDVEISAVPFTYQGQAGALVFARDITDRKAAAVALRRSGEQLRALSARLEHLREEERTRISREIHDELGQLLTGLKMDLRWVETRLERLNELPDINPILDKMVAATELANTIIKAVQRIAAELRPGVLDRLGLATALRYEAARFEERTHIPCRLEETAQDPDVADEVKTALFRIFQESLTNVARHAAAGKVAIRFEKQGTDWLLEVRDDGRGIPPEAVGGVTSLGLLGMRERARLVGGEVTVTRAEPRGTVVTVRVPVSAPATLNRS